MITESLVTLSSAEKPTLFAPYSYACYVKCTILISCVFLCAVLILLSCSRLWKDLPCGSRNSGRTPFAVLVPCCPLPSWILCRFIAPVRAKGTVLMPRVAPLRPHSYRCTARGRPDSGQAYRDILLAYRAAFPAPPTRRPPP